MSESVWWIESQAVGERHINPQSPVITVHYGVVGAVTSLCWFDARSDKNSVDGNPILVLQVCLWWVCWSVQIEDGFRHAQAGEHRAKGFAADVFARSGGQFGGRCSGGERMGRREKPWLSTTCGRNGFV